MGRVISNLLNTLIQESILLVGLVLRILLVTLAQLLQSLIRTLMPILIPALIASLAFLAERLVMAWGAVGLGIWTAIENVANDRGYRLIGKGVPPEVEDRLHGAALAMIVVEMVVGWVCLSYVTVLLVNWIVSLLF